MRGKILILCIAILAILLLACDPPTVPVDAVATGVAGAATATAKAEARTVEARVTRASERATREAPGVGH